MDNLLPSFRRPGAAPSRPAADIMAADARKHPPKSAARESAKAAATLASLKVKRRAQTEVHMDGWPLDPPYLRHTVLYSGKPPSPVQPSQRRGSRDGGSGADAGGDGDGDDPATLPLAASMPLTLHDDPGTLCDATAPGMHAMAVSLRRGQFTVPRTQLRGSGNNGVKVPLPSERAAGRREALELGGRYQLPAMIFARTPVDSRGAPVPQVAGTRPRHRTGPLPGPAVPPELPEVRVVPTTVVFANGHTAASAEVFMNVTGKVQRTRLPPLSGSAQSFGSSRACRALSSRPFALPAEFQFLPAAVGPEPYLSPRSTASDTSADAVARAVAERVGLPPPASHTNPKPGQFLFNAAAAADPAVAGAPHPPPAAGAGAGASAALVVVPEASTGTSPPHTAFPSPEPAASTPAPAAVFYDNTDNAGVSLPPPSAMTGMFFGFLPGADGVSLRLPPSVADDTPVVLLFRNSHSAEAMEVYWVDYDGQLVQRRVLTPGGHYQELTWATHPWVVRNPVSKESVLFNVGPGCVQEPMSCSVVWNSDASNRRVSLFWESSAAKRLAAPGRASLAAPALGHTATPSALLATGKAVLQLGDGTADHDATLALDHKLQTPKIVFSMAAPARGKSFLKSALQVRADKQRPKPRR